MCLKHTGSEHFTLLYTPLDLFIYFIEVYTERVENADGRETVWLIVNAASSYISSTKGKLYTQSAAPHCV